MGQVRSSRSGATVVGAPSRWQRRGREVARLLGHRLLAAIPVVLAVTAVVFAMAAHSPFDPLAAHLGDRYVTSTQAQRDELTRALGLDTPWWRVWIDWIGALLHGDLGYSRVFSQPVSQVIAERLPWTMLLSALALIAAAVLGLLLGAVAGLRPGGIVDRLCSGLAVLLQAMPPFVLSLGAIALFSLGLHWLPTGGIGPADGSGSATELARHLVLPVTVFALSQLPWLILTTRASIGEALVSDPVRAATARGLPRSVVIRSHVLPVSLAPLVTVLGTRLPELVVGAVIVEEVFGWPGVAAALVESARQLDFSLLAVLTVATTLLVLVGSALADSAYLLLDPRVRADG